MITDRVKRRVSFVNRQTYKKQHHRKLPVKFLSPARGSGVAAGPNETGYFLPGIFLHVAGENLRYGKFAESLSF
jgi:hypothetical protein